jgi:hypothetical protein
MERRIKILMIAHIFIVIWCYHFFGLKSSISGLVHYGLDYNPFYFLRYPVGLASLVMLAGSIPIIIFSIAIAYHLYRSNEKKYHKISAINIFFCSILFFCYTLLHIRTLYLWDDLYFLSRDIWFASLLGIPLLSIVTFLIPTMPSIFTIRYANQNELEFHLSLFLFFGSTILMMGFPIFLSSIGMIPYIRATYLLGEPSYVLIIVIGWVCIFSFISMIIGVILAIKGAVGLLKSKGENS